MTSMQFDEINRLPHEDNENILRVISTLGLIDKPIYIDIIPDTNSRNGDCFLNVLDKVKIANGEAVYGWQFAEYAFMIEAEFHAVWKSSEGTLIDITPSADPTAKKILFVIDRNKKFDGTRTDNFRLNTTQNKLVDDIIEIERAKFKLINEAKSVNERDEVQFNKEEEIKWIVVNEFSVIVDEMCRQNMTVLSKCFCNSGKTYEECHRPILKHLLTTL